MKLFIFLAILRRIWWRETHDSILNTLKWIQFSSLTNFSSTAFQGGVWTEPCTNLFSLLMILFCGQEMKLADFLPVSVLTASCPFANKWTVLCLSGTFSDEKYRAWIIFLFPLFGHLTIVTLAAVKGKLNCLCCVWSVNYCYFCGFYML